MNRLDTEIRRAMGELDAVAPMARPLEQLNTRPPQRSRPVAAVTLALVVSLSVAIAATVIYARTGEHSAIAPSGSTADSLPTDPTTSPSPTATVGEPSPTELAPGLPILVPTDLPAPLFVWSVGRGRQFSAGQTSECYYFAVSALEEPPGPWPSSDVVRVKVCNAAMAGDGDVSTVQADDSWTPIDEPSPRLVRRLAGGGVVVVADGDRSARADVADSLRPGDVDALVALRDASGARVRAMPLLATADFGDIVVERRGPDFDVPGGWCIRRSGHEQCRPTIGTTPSSADLALDGVWYAVGAYGTASEESPTATFAVDGDIPSSLSVTDPRVLPQQQKDVAGATIWLVVVPEGVDAIASGFVTASDPGLVWPISGTSAVVALVDPRGGAYL